MKLTQKTKTPRLGTLADIKAGYAPRRGLDEEKIGEIAFLQIGDFSEDRRRIEKVPTRIDPEGSNPRMLQEGDVLFLAKGRKPFGYALGKIKQPTTAAGYFFIIRPRQIVMPQYLAWYLSLDSTKRWLLGEAGSGIHMPVVRREVLENMEIPLPPLAVQNAVVELADLVRKEDELLAELKKLRAQLMGKILKELIVKGDA